MDIPESQKILEIGLADRAVPCLIFIYLQNNIMRKTVITPLVAIALLLFFLAPTNAQYEFFTDHFNRSTPSPWTQGVISPCSTPLNNITIEPDGGEGYLKISVEQNCTTGAVIDLGTYVKDWDIYIGDWGGTLGDDIMILEMAGQGKAVSIRFNKYTNSIEIGQRDWTQDFQLHSFPYSYRAITPYNFSNFNLFSIKKSGNTINIGNWSTGEPYLNWTVVDSNNDVWLKTIAIFEYNPSHSSYNKDNYIAVVSEGGIKILPNLTMSVSPSYNVSYGTHQTVSCYADVTGIPTSLYYFGSPVSNPYTAILPLGTNYFECISNETDTYYSASAVLLAYTYTPSVTTITVPSPIPNASKPVPQMVNETEWQEAGYGWALFFLSPLMLITYLSLLLAAGTAKAVGGQNPAAVFTITFLFIWLLLIAYTGVLETWIFIVLIIIASAIVVYFGRSVITK